MLYFFFLTQIFDAGDPRFQPWNFARFGRLVGPDKGEGKAAAVAL